MKLEDLKDPRDREAAQRAEKAESYRTLPDRISHNTKRRTKLNGSGPLQPKQVSPVVDFLEFAEHLEETLAN